MNDQIVMSEIMDLFSFLQNHVGLYTKTSFNDVGLSLETLFMDVMNAIEEEKVWKNANSITYNYPAIDLINERDCKAMQITTNADKVKIDNTISKYNSHGYKYNSLIILGFISNIKYNKSNVRSVGINYITGLIKGCSLQKKMKILELIMTFIPVQLLVPLSDLNCFKIIYNHINRSAIRDNRYSEGSYEDMLKGLIDVKTLITAGGIKKSSVKTKAIFNYQEHIQVDLERIEYSISKIIGICNQNNQGGFVNLNWEDKTQIDKLKDEIIDYTNEICKNLGINKKMKR